MNRFLLFVIVLLIGANGYTYYQKWRFASAFDQREELLLDAQRRLEAKAYILEVRGDSLRAEFELLSQRLAGTRLTVESLRCHLLWNILPALEFEQIPFLHFA